MKTKFYLSDKLFDYLSVFVMLLFMFVPLCSVAQNVTTLKVRGENYGIETLKKGAQPFFNRPAVSFGDIAEGYEGWNYIKINANSSYLPGPLPVLEVLSARSGYVTVMVATGEKPDVCSQWATDNGWELIPGKTIEYSPGGELCTLTFYQKKIEADEWMQIVQPATFSGAIVIAPTIREYSPEQTNRDLFDEACARIDSKMNEFVDFTGVQAEMSDYLLEVQDRVASLEDDNDPIFLDVVEDIDSYLSKIDIAMSKIKKATDLFDECASIFESEVIYPDFDKLSEAYEVADAIYAGGEAGLDELLSAFDTLKARILGYYNSQIPFATEDKPAELTYMVKAPNFRESYAYSPDCALSSEGWYSVNTGLPGEGNCFYPVHKPASEVGRDVTCYNSWTWQFTHMNLYQDVKGLPDGWYKVECLGWTTEQDVYKQHAYAVSMADSALSENGTEAMVNWQKFSTGVVPVYDGNLRIGFESESGGGTKGWFLVTDFKLLYCGALSEETLRPILEKSIAEGKAKADTMLFAFDRKALLDSIYKYEEAASAVEMKAAIMSLNKELEKASASVNTQVKVLNGIYKAINDSIDEDVYVGDYAVMAECFCNCMESEINAEYATYTEMDSLERILYAFRDSYIPTLVSARGLSVVDATAKAVLDDNINRQIKDFTSLKNLPLKEKIDAYVDELEKAIAECIAADVILGGGTDFTALIVNPTIDNLSTSVMPKGWYGYVINGNGYTGYSQQVDGDVSGHYLDAYNGTPGALCYNMYQTIETVPNGLYRLTAMTRTTSEHGTYLYAFADNDSSTVTLSEVELERINITELGGPEAKDGGDSIAIVTDTYGSIFADVYKRTNGGQNATDAENDTLMVNNGWGRGWHYTSVDIEVKNHVLTFGYTTDSTFTKKFGGAPFKGTWMSADNFRLTQIAAGDNEGWNPAAGIDGVDDDSNIDVKVENGRIIAPRGALIYSISGLLFDSDSSLPAGIYIVKYGKMAVKVMVD